jgi:hypothetical protein
MRLSTIPLITACLLPCIAWCQTPFADGNQAEADPYQHVFAEMVGMMDQDQRLYIEGNGYSMAIKSHDWAPGHKAYEKTLKRLLPKSVVTSTDDARWPLPNRTWASSDTAGGLHQRFYFLPNGTSMYWVVYFATPIASDTAFEHAVLGRLLAKGKSFVTTVDHPAKEMTFCGRVIKLGSACHWMAPHNCQCSGLGQMNWGVTTDHDRAVARLHAQMNATINEREVVSRDTVHVIFEGQDVSAVRIAYKVPGMVRVVGQTSRTIIAYYLTAVVRGRHLHCVLSHFDDEAPEGLLPRLLNEVMTLR